MANDIEISISRADADQLLALLKTSNTFPDVVQELAEAIESDDAYKAAKADYGRQPRTRDHECIGTGCPTCMAMKE